MAPFFILAVHIAIASPLLPLAFSTLGGRGVGGGLGESCVELAERSQEFFNNSIVQAVVVVVVVVAV
jgi:hypothetical protein